ncbi:MAG: hypothetical protein LBR97_10365, partial [Dysgonamonadaceae bacterium]|nr:hypothetical protein [Dysgonamonadaceae bacterium]
MKKMKFIFILAALTGAGLMTGHAQPAGRMQSYDLSKDRLLYAIGYSHLDTQWNWDYVRSIDELLKNIMTE